MRRVLLPFLAASLILGTLVVAPSLATHQLDSLPGSNFEIDRNANLKVDDAGRDDWASVSEDRNADEPSGKGDDSYTGGAKEDDLCPSTSTGSIPPNKSDLLNFGLYEEEGSPGFLHLFWHRVQEPSGTTLMDFELNQSQTACSNGVNPVRTEGDLLIEYRLEQGGATADIFLREWEGSAWGDAEHISASGDATGTINSTAIPASESDGLGAISPRTFGEATIDLEVIFDATECTSFGSAFLKSRSSTAFTSALKDFIKPLEISLANCGSLKIVKKDQAGNNLAGAEFSVYEDDGDGVFEPGTDDEVVDTCTTTANGTGDCTFADLLVGSKFWVHETAAPPGYVIDPLQTNPTLVTITGLNEHVVTFTNNPAVGDITVSKTGDDGATMNGVKFTLKGTSDFGTSVDLECITGTSNSSGAATPAAGTCSFLNVEIGTYALDEDATTLPAGYSKDPTLPKNVSITSAGQTVNVSVTNPRTHRVVVLVCHEGTDTLLATDVVNGASTKTSIGAVPSGLADKGVTAKELCDLGGASFGGLGHTDKTTTAKLSTAHTP